MASTIKVTDITYPGSANPALTINADDSVSIGGGVISPQTGFKNRIINGAMTIDQRNAGAAVTSDTYCPDRWRVEEVTDGAFSAQQVVDAPVGFVNSLRWTVTTADASLGATQYASVRQGIEGFNVDDLGWGTANAQTVTLSFWVKSSLTGTFGGAFGNAAFNRSYAFTYAINAANTWEYKTVTVAGDTTGTWEKTNSAGIQLNFGLGVGSTYSGTAGAWAASGLISATGAVNVMGTLSATWAITGVQLEKGSTATPFEFRSIGQELALCQRYCVSYGGNSAYEIVSNGFAISTGEVNAITALPIQMRATPSMSVVGAFQISDGVTGFIVFVFSLLAIQTGTQQVCISATSSGLTTHRPYRIEANNSTAARIFFISEL
jgi:hypothetical protein